MNNKAKGKVLIENERARVTEWSFSKGSATGWHQHEYDYIVVPMLDGKLELFSKTGNNTFSELKKGIPYFRKAGIEHNVRNANDFDYKFMEIEIK